MEGCLVEKIRPTVFPLAFCSLKLVSDFLTKCPIYRRWSQLLPTIFETFEFYVGNNLQTSVGVLRRKLFLFYLSIEIELSSNDEILLV